MRVQHEEPESAEVQFAPLIDIVFLLLIFFLVATTLKKIDRELPLDLPQSQAAIQVKGTSEMLVIGVDPAGQMYLGTEPITTEMLLQRLRAAPPTRKVRIAGDRLTPLQHIVHVLDQCRFAGLTDVSIHIRDREPQ